MCTRETECLTGTTTTLHCPGFCPHLAETGESSPTDCSWKKILTGLLAAAVLCWNCYDPIKGQPEGVYIENGGGGDSEKQATNQWKRIRRSFPQGKGNPKDFAASPWCIRRSSHNCPNPALEATAVFDLLFRPWLLILEADCLVPFPTFACHRQEFFFPG